MHQIRTPLCRITLVAGLLTLSARHTHGVEASFQRVALDGFPSFAGEGIIGLLSTVMPLHQLMGPDRTALGVIVARGDRVKRPAVVSQPGILETHPPSRLPLCPRKTGQQLASCMVACVHRKRTLGSPPMQTARVADIDHAKPSAAVTSRVF